MEKSVSREVFKIIGLLKSNRQRPNKLLRNAASSVPTHNDFSAQVCVHLCTALPAPLPILLEFLYDPHHFFIGKQGRFSQGFHLAVDAREVLDDLIIAIENQAVAHL